MQSPGCLIFVGNPLYLPTREVFFTYTVSLMELRHGHGEDQIVLPTIDVLVRDICFRNG